MRLVHPKKQQGKKIVVIVGAGFGGLNAAKVLTEAVLASQRIIPKRVLESGFKFQFSSLEKALEDVYSSKKEFH